MMNVECGMMNGFCKAQSPPLEGPLSRGGHLAASLLKKSYNRRVTVDIRILKMNEINLPDYFYK